MEHIDWYPRLWIDGTRELTAEERGVYMDLINLMYDLGGPITEDARWLAGHCNVSTRRFSTILARLIALGKIRRLEGFGEVSSSKLTGNRVETELNRARTAIEQRRNARAKRKGVTQNQYVSSDGRTDRVTTAVPPTITIQEQESSLPQMISEGGGSGEAETLRLAEDGQPFPSSGSRAEGTNPRAQGTSLRQRGINPRALGSNPRARPAPAVPPSPAPAGTPETDAMFQALRAELGETAFRAWMAPLQVASVNGSIRIRAPTAFHASHVRGAWGDRMRTISGADVEIEAG